jgi:hypothetical protein
MKSKRVRSSDHSLDKTKAMITNSASIAREERDRRSESDRDNAYNAIVVHSFLLG